MEVIASRAFWWWQGKIAVVAQGLQQGGIDDAPCAPRAVGIVILSLMAGDPGIHQDIAGTGVETGRRLPLTCRQNADVADAADIDDDAGFFVAAEHGLMKCRNQRRALTAGGDIAAAKVGDDVDAA